MRNIVQVFLGGSFGAVLRFNIQLYTGTTQMLWIVNVLGSFFLGWLNGYFERKESKYKLLFTTGMLGAFTTFSTFSDQSIVLLQENVLTGVSFIVGMTFASVIAAMLGYWFSRGKKLWK